MPIHESNIFGKSAPKILVGLFIAAGVKDYPADSTARSWLNGNRNCKVSSYFPNGEDDVKQEGIFYYFKGKSDSKLRELQKIFRKVIPKNSDNHIDVETDDMDIFCWSLVNQFLDLLGFPRLILYTESSADRSIESGQPLNSQKRSIRSLILPHSDGDCCYRCDYWDGDRETIGAYRAATYGVCVKYNRREQLSSAPACKDYKKHLKLPGEW